MKDKFDDFGDDFFGRWEEFNRLMVNSPLIRDEMEKFLRMLMDSNDLNNEISNIRIIPLNAYKPNDIDSFDIPENELDVEIGENENGKWETKSWTSPDGSMSFKSFSMSSTPEEFFYKNLMSDLFQTGDNRNSKKYTTEDLKNFKIEKLQKSLNAAVEVEDYEKAAELKKMIEKIKEENFDNKK
jgi:hypothetical protein